MDDFFGLTDCIRGLSFGSVVFRLFAAILIGGAIGLEREYRNRPAGFRTHMLVCLGASLAMMFGQYCAELCAGYDSNVHTDVARVAAQVINGVGFLGAGTVIITERQKVRGLTTAAGLWASACLGLAIGAGFMECVLVGFIFVFVSMKLFSLLEQKLIRYIRAMNLYVELDTIADIGEVTSLLREYGVTVYSIETSGKEKLPLGSVSAMLSIRLPKTMQRNRVQALLNSVESVRAMEEL